MLSSKSMKNGLLGILNDRAGRGRKRDEEDGRSDAEEGARKRVKKNEKSCKKIKKSLEDASLTPAVLLILGSWSLSAESWSVLGRSVNWSWVGRSIGPQSVH